MTPATTRPRGRGDAASGVEEVPLAAWPPYPLAIGVAAVVEAGHGSVTAPPAAPTVVGPQRFVSPVHDCPVQ
jgi:hypothetical protein